MYSSDASFDAYDQHGQAGPLILGVPWPAPHGLVRAAAKLAAALEVHLLCAYVDPASYLTEWEEPRNLSAASLDPAANEEAAYPAGEVRLQVESLLGPAGSDWSFRVLNGDISPALSRLADSTGASMFIVGAGRDGVLPRISRLLEGSVSSGLARLQNRPVVLVPEHAERRRQGLRHHRAGA